MPRDANGNYTLPAGNPVTPGDVIEDTWANPTMSDIAIALTDSLSRTGKGGMQVQFKNADGTVGGPGIGWINEPTSGWYRKSLNEFWYSVGNEDIFQITKTGIQLAPGKTALGIAPPPITIQDTEFTAATKGQEWFESDSGGLYMRYQNPDLTFSWVLINGATTGNYVPQTDKGIANGVATLDSGTKVPVAQIPAIPVANLPAGVANGVASLDSGGKVPAAQLPTVTASPTMQIFTASGTWTKPAGLRKVKVTVIGGGGGSGGVGATAGTQASAAAGAASGGASIKYIAAASLGATETVTVGAAGTAGASGASTGGTGGTSSFGAHCSATGGAGSNGTGPRGDTFITAANAAPGIGSGGDINLSGRAGQNGAACGVAATGIGGGGGASLFSGGSVSTSVTGTSPGSVGLPYGGGATGAANGQSQAASGGSAGAAGVVIVEEYY